jgi:hypothetical protein
MRGRTGSENQVSTLGLASAATSAIDIARGVAGLVRRELHVNAC